MKWKAYHFISFLFLSAVVLDRGKNEIKVG